VANFASTNANYSSRRSDFSGIDFCKWESSWEQLAAVAIRMALLLIYWEASGTAFAVSILLPDALAVTISYQRDLELQLLAK
jgi:hypothetical protein